MKSFVRIVQARETAALAWVIGLVAELRGVRHAAHEDAVGGEIHGAELHVRLEEEAVLVGRAP